MADHDNISDAELVAELRNYGEEVTLPIKKKREILVKKLNHLRARARQQESPVAARNKNSSPSRSTGLARRGRPNVIRPVEDDDTEEEDEGPRRTRSSQPSTRSRSLRSSTTRSSSQLKSMLDTFSSDDSEAEGLDSHFSNTRTNTNDASVGGAGFSGNRSFDSVSSNNRQPDRKRTSQFSTNVLRTIRRRTGEQVPYRQSRHRGNEVFELSADQDSPNNSVLSRQTTDPDLNADSSPDASPARSRLYPSLRNFAKSITNNRNKREVFESSDSDIESSTYEVENKSINTSLPYGFTPSPLNRSNIASSPTLSDSNSSGVRPKLIAKRRPSGRHRVQQYKSVISEHLPHLLVGVAFLFFLFLVVMYTLNHKDWIFSLFPSRNLGSNDDLLLCPDGRPGQKCYDRGEVDRSLDLIKSLFDELSQRKGNALCNSEQGLEYLDASTFRKKIEGKTVSANTADRLYKCCIDHILANPHWNIRALKDDLSPAETAVDVEKFESEVASMGLRCRFMRSFTTVMYGIFSITMVLVIAVLACAWMQRKQKQKEEEQIEVYAMVEKIIGVLQDHHTQTRRDNSGDPPYLAVQHVRDQLLPPAQRKKLQPIWVKAFDFISAHESRIRLETRLIHGDEFEVWQWLPQTSNNGKIWQGQAFGEFNENGTKEVKYSPTPCLKIRNMFDCNIECEDGWESNVIDAVLEKLEDAGPVLHICVDAESQEGLVYLKCASLEAAGLARLALHGWWFDGRLVTAKHLKLDRYHKRWPEAQYADTPLHPSTNTNKSLSQPYHRSSLEMT